MVTAASVGNVIWALVLIFGIAWLAFYLGWQRGYQYGYAEGFGDGVKKGKEEGAKAGIKSAVKEQVLNSIAGNKGGVWTDVEQQVRQEVLAALNKPAAPKSAPPPETWWDSVSKHLLKFAALILFGVILFALLHGQR